MVAGREALMGRFRGVATRYCRASSGVRSPARAANRRTNNVWAVRPAAGLIRSANPESRGEAEAEKELQLRMVSNSLPGTTSSAIPAPVDDVFKNEEDG